jgi:replicative DNA helicase
VGSAGLNRCGFQSSIRAGRSQAAYLLARHFLASIGWAAGDRIAGKTAFARNIAYNVAAQTENNSELGAVVFFSQEMDDEEIAMDGWAADTGISYFKVASGNLTDDEFAAIKPNRSLL